MSLQSATPSGVLPNMPLVLNAQYPRRVRASTDGARILYAVVNGVVARTLPDQSDPKRPLVEVYQRVDPQENGHLMLAEHTTPCMEVAGMSPDQQLVVAGDSQGTLHLWTNGREGSLMRSWNCGLNSIRLSDLCFSDDGRHLIVVGHGPSAQGSCGAILRVDTGTRVGLLGRGTGGGFLCVSLQSRKPNMIVCGGVDGDIFFFSMENPSQLLYRGKTEAPVTCIRFSPNSTALASCGQDGRILGWNVATGSVEREIRISTTHPLLDLAWSQDSSRVAVVGGDGYARVVDYASGMILDETFVGLPHEAVSPVGVCWTTTDWLVVQTSCGRIWGYKTEQQQTLSLAQRFLWQGLQGFATAVDMNLRSNRAVIGDSLGNLLFLSLAGAEPRVSNVMALPSATRVQSVVVGTDFGAAITKDGFIRLYSFPKDLDLSAKSLTSSEGPPGARDQWDAPKAADANTKPLPVSSSLATSVKSIYCCADGLTAISSSGPLKMKPTHDSFIVGALKFKGVPSAAVAIDDCRVIAVFTECGNMHLYPFNASGAQFYPLRSLKLYGKVTAAAATPDGGLLAVALTLDDQYPAARVQSGRKKGKNVTHAIEIYEIDDATKEDGIHFVCIYDCHAAEITSLAINAAGTYIASADTDLNLYVVDIESGKQVIEGEWKYHTARITSLAWASNNSRLVSASLDGNLAIWNIEQRRDKFAIPAPLSQRATFATFLFNNLLLTGGRNASLAALELTFPGEEEGTAA